MNLALLSSPPAFLKPLLRANLSSLGSNLLRVLILAWLMSFVLLGSSVEAAQINALNTTTATGTVVWH